MTIDRESLVVLSSKLNLEGKLASLLSWSLFLRDLATSIVVSQRGWCIIIAIITWSLICFCTLFERKQESWRSLFLWQNSFMVLSMKLVKMRVSAWVQGYLESTQESNFPSRRKSQMEMNVFLHNNSRNSSKNSRRGNLFNLSRDQIDSRLTFSCFPAKTKKNTDSSSSLFTTSTYLKGFKHFSFHYQRKRREGRKPDNFLFLEASFQLLVPLKWLSSQMSSNCIKSK